MLNNIFTCCIKQHRDLLLRKPYIFAVKTDIDIGYFVIILIKDELTVSWLIGIAITDYMFPIIPLPQFFTKRLPARCFHPTNIIISSCE